MEVITCGMTTEHSLPYMVFFVSVLIDFVRKRSIRLSEVMWIVGSFCALELVARKQNESAASLSHTT